MKRNRILSILLCNMILFSGSSGVFAEDDKELKTRDNIEVKAEKSSFKEIDNIDYVSLNSYEIKDEKIKKWISNNEKTSGIFLLEKEDAYYILISGGECPTGGYSIDIMNVQLNEGKLDITYNVVPPAADMMVTQVLSYPSQVIKISKSDKTDGLTIKERKKIYYQPLDSYEIKDQKIQKWISNNKKKAGAYLLEGDNAYYVLIAGGEHPTGGYRLEILSRNLLDGKLDVTYKVVPPAPNMMVTQALTYPYQVFKMSKDMKIEEVNAVKKGNNILPNKPEVRINENTTLGEIEEAIKNIKDPQEKLNLIQKLTNWIIELF